MDGTLRGIFGCADPAATLDAQVATALRAVCRVPVATLARAFLVSESTMARRLVLARGQVGEPGPDKLTEAERTERLPGVLAVLYLLFTCGYDTDSRLADEAIRLTRLLEPLVPAQPDVPALLALFLFQHSRRAARRDPRGDLVTLDRQDRSRWDRAAIEEGLRALRRCGTDSPYALQARIAACHARAARPQETDWPAIAACYDELAARQPSAVVLLNRAVAHGYAYGPDAGLALLEQAWAGGELDGHPPAIAARAEFTARRGEKHSAAVLFRRAADLSTDAGQRRALLARAGEIAAEVSG